MTQLDLFSLPTPPAKPGDMPVEKVRTEKEIVEESVAVEFTNNEEGVQPIFAREEVIAENNVTLQPEEKIAPPTSAPVTNERVGNIVFEDNNITVKIKARSLPKTAETPLVPPPVDQIISAKIKTPARPSIVTKQVKTEYSIALNDKLSQVKNNIKEGLLKEPVEKKKNDKGEKPVQKRGRKSFKEMDAEPDLVDVPDDDVLFKKQYYSISEVAGWFNVNTSLIRFWENEFDILKPKKNRKGDRLFRPEDVKNLQLIFQLLRQRKYSIEGAKEFLKANKSKADVQMLLSNSLQNFRSFLLELKANLQ